MMDIQAALGLHQLARVEALWPRRCALWQRYNVAFADLPVERPTEPEAGTRHAYHLYTLRVDPARAGITRDKFLDAMTAHRIGVGVHYMSIPEHPYYQRAFGWKPTDYPHAMRIGRETISLPLSAKLSDADAQDVIAAVRAIVGPETGRLGSRA